MIRLEITEAGAADLSADVDGSAAIVWTGIPDVGTVKLSGPGVRKLLEASLHRLDQQELGEVLVPDWHARQYEPCPGSGATRVRLHACGVSRPIRYGIEYCPDCCQWVDMETDPWGLPVFSQHTRRVDSDIEIKASR